MVPLNILLLLASALATSSTAAPGHPIATMPPARAAQSAVPSSSATIPASAPWPVATTLKSTLRTWARRQGWPEPQFLTEADWAVDVPGVIPGSIEDALKALMQGFEKSQTRPRIELTANHVILVSETGAD